MSYTSNEEIKRMTGVSSARWLNAHHDPLAAIHTFSTCITLADISGDGDNKLVLADFGKGKGNVKLKVFKGTTLLTENTIVDVPAAVVSFYMDCIEPRIPALAVASGSHIYIYKNMRPYFKFTLPSLEVNSLEKDLWSQVHDEAISVEVLYEALLDLRNSVGESALTTRSQRFLLLEPNQLAPFLQAHKMHPLKKQTVVTTMCVLKKSLSEEDAVACLIIGTENGKLYVLDPQAFTVLDCMSLPGTPSCMSATGLYDVEFCILVCTRDGKLCLLRRGWKEAKVVSEMKSQPIALLNVEKHLVVGFMDDTIASYSMKGKRLWSMKLDSSILCLTYVYIHNLGLKLVGVGLESGWIKLYSGQQLVDSIHVEGSPVSACVFGRFGREDNTLVIITRDGGVHVRMLKRTAQFETRGAISSQQSPALAKLAVPKKTKLFVDQTMRERECYVDMHATFQQQLHRLRLTTARAYVSAIQSRQTPMMQSSTPDLEPLRLSAQVMGLGPSFILQVAVQNMSNSSSCMGLQLTFGCDDKLYIVDPVLIHIPLLPPGISYHSKAKVECISEIPVAEHIRVFVLKEGLTSPLLCALVHMPQPEMMIQI